MTTADSTATSAAHPGDGRMPLAEHLRELRSRIVKSVLAVAVLTAVAWVFYDPLFQVIQQPLDPVKAQALREGRTPIVLNFADITSPFMTRVKISLLAGALASCPVWIYQLWRFVTPGMHKHERRWTILFLCATVPLFLLGVVLGYLVLPKGLQLLLINFAPDDTSNFLTVDRYLSFFIRTIVVFGASFLTPLFIIALNLAGVLSARTLQHAWRWIVMGVFVFAAAATPSQDPWSMLVLALPMLVLVFAALGICWLNDRRRYGRTVDFDDLDDDEASPIEAPTSLDDAPPRRSTDDLT